MRRERVKIVRTFQNDAVTNCVVERRCGPGSRVAERSRGAAAELRTETTSSTEWISDKQL